MPDIKYGYIAMWGKKGEDLGMEGNEFDEDGKELVLNYFPLGGGS